MVHRQYPARANAARKSSLRAILAGTASLCALTTAPAMAGNIATASTTYNASGLGNSVSPVFQGGTLVVDSASNPAYSQNFTLDTSTSNTIDQNGNSATFSGIFSDAVSGSAGNIIFANGSSGGAITLTGVNSYTGTTTINTGASLILNGSGSIATSSHLYDGGIFDISTTTSGAAIESLSGAGSVVLGSRTLAITSAADTFSGVISGTGGLNVTSGTQILTGANTYTGGTTVSGGMLELADGGSILGNVSVTGVLAFAHSDNISFDGTIAGAGGLTQMGGGTLTLTAAENYTGVTTISSGVLVLSNTASIANSSQVNVAGTLDISATSGVSIKSLGGAGQVNLGNQTLTFTSASGTFTGVISGSGGVTVTGGVETLTGINTYTGATTVTGGTLQLGASSVTNNITNSGTVGFFSSGAMTYSGVISGTGAVAQSGAGITSVTTMQAYTGATSITGGTLALVGAGDISASSGLSNGGIFDISGAAGSVTLQSITGNGTIKLGNQQLVLNNASGTYSGNISGAGDLVIAGGRQTLSGTTSFTGVTQINAGALYLASTSALASSSKVVDNALLDVSASTSAASIQLTTINSLAGSGQVALGTTTLQLSNAGDTFSGVIAGSGGVTVSGGTETLTGANTYTGTTSILGGSLVLAGNASLYSAGTVNANGTFDVSGLTSGSVAIGTLSGSGAVVLGGNGLNITNGSTVFSGVISGTGALTVTGGTQILTGTNTYGGGTTISAGTLQLGRALTSGSITGDVTDNGTLAFDRSDNFVFAGAISGTGGVVQMGSGTAALTGANSYSGGTTISAGTLQVGNGGTSGVITGNVADSGTLAFNRSDAQTFAGTISGTGAVTVLGTGPLTLTAVNSYTGTTTIATGADLVLGSAASIASSSSVVDNGTLDLSGAGTPQLASLGGNGAVSLGANTLTLNNGADTFAGVISGTGGLTVTGGKQAVSGMNSYTGATTVNGGTLTVNGSIASSSSVTVNSGGTLAGTGTVSSVTVNSGGSLAPGSGGTGTLAVNGNVAFASGSTFVVNTTSTTSSKLTATGIASLAGTLSASSADGTLLLGQKMTVLTATGGISGSFAVAPITSTGAQFTPSVTYDANNVYLTVNLAKLAPLLPTTATLNQQAPVAGIDRAIAAGATLAAPLQQLGTLTSAGLATAATQLAGEPGADLAEAGRSMFNPFLDTVFDRIQDRSASKRSAWASGFAGSRIVNGDDTLGSQKFKSHASGFAVGYDWHTTSGGVLGVALSQGSANFHLANSMGNGSLDSWQAGLYGWLPLGRHAYNAFMLGGGLDDLSTTRTLTVSGTDMLSAKPKGLTFGGRYEAGVILPLLTPYIAVEDRMFHRNGYNESAVSGTSNFALAFGAQTANSIDAELGLRQSMDVPLDRIWSIRLSDRLAWVHDMSGLDSASASFASAPASGFTVYGAHTGRDAGRLSLGAMLFNKTGLGLDLHMEAQSSAHSQSYTGIAGLNVTW